MVGIIVSKFCCDRCGDQCCPDQASCVVVISPFVWNTCWTVFLMGLPSKDIGEAVAYWVARLLP